jgi:V-type H+-transporting ATPase subunit H
VGLGRKTLLEVACSLLKQPAYRSVVWESETVSGAIKEALNSSSNHSELYKSVFALWITSFDNKVITEVNKNLNLIKAVEAVLKTSRSEKVVRISIALLRNILDFPKSIPDVVESSISISLQNLEYEKWKEQDLYAEIKDLQLRLAETISTHYIIARFERELDSGVLNLGHVHSERFWMENAVNFEAQDFIMIKQLVNLLTSSTDGTTLAIACFDIGEFARAHPFGKRALAKTDAKSKVMALMTHSIREVAREALLCTQKLMLNNWQSVA